MGNKFIACAGRENRNEILDQLSRSRRHSALHGFIIIHLYGKLNLGQLTVNPNSSIVSDGVVDGGSL